eukprot:CAMPEP_0117820504 /NCGR_PEP_ID=MMETSP0949-20121206/2498_1 /TAXON_ID=44440 /ORGANISM="Chattonella subsalsa, Strain CCMP2191" /LENGTH=48 /DNA_ID= /DNA_START= /DNA_END= /DNA_ORIENTATION=
MTSFLSGKLTSSLEFAICSAGTSAFGWVGAGAGAGAGGAKGSKSACWL